jgi:DNA-binding SARP family transcriptional activator/DNA polymerase III delta prime subunit
VEFAILGPLEVRRDGTPVAINAPKQRALLLRLLVEPGHVVPTDRLIEDLWDGTPPPGALSSLRAYVSNLRRALSNGTAATSAPLVTRASGYALDVDPATIDARGFEDGLARAREELSAGTPERALRSLDEALARWRGPALVDVADAGFARPSITRLEELRRLAHEERFAAQLAAGHHDAAIADLERFTANEPLRERPRRQLALALHRAGRTADALQVHRAFRDSLVAELGLDPSEEFDELAGRILRRDPALELPAPEPTGSDAERQPVSGTAPASGRAQPEAPDDAASDRRPAAGPGMLGREPERRAIAEALARAVNGQGTLLLFGGEPGIGKTTLLDEVARQAAGSLPVHWGRCPETDGAPAFWPWIRLLRSITGELDDGRLAAATAGLSSLTHLIPTLTARLGMSLATCDDLHAARFGLFDETASFLHRIAGGGMVLLLDDLHWADAPSLELLTFLLPQLEAAPLLIAATYRDVPAERSAALDAALATAARHPIATDLHLTGLDHAQVAGVVAAALGRPPGDDLVDVLHQRTDGNPFFVTQLARLLEESAPSTPASAIPTGVRHVIVRRLQLLPSDTQHLLELAAVVGRSFDAAVVAAAAGSPLPTVLDAMDAGFAHGLVEPEGGSARRFRFVHALIRETLHDGLSPATTARSHAAVAGAFEATMGCSAQELAEHYWLASDLVPHARTIRWAVAAADEALESLAYEQAESHLRRALRLLEDGQAELATELAVRARLVSLLTSVVGWSAPDIPGIAGRVRALAEVHGLRPELLPLWHLLWTSRTTRGDLEGGLTLAKELFAAAEQAGDELHRAMARSMWGYCELHLGGDGRRNLDRILTAKEELDRQPAEYLAATPEHLGVTVRLAVAIATALAASRRETLEAARDGVAYAAELGRPFPLVAAHLFAGWAAAVVDEPGVAAEATTAALELCERSGFRQAANLLTPIDAWAAARLGADAAEQAERMVRAIEALEASGHLHARPQWSVLLAEVLLLAGDVEGAAARVADGRAIVAVTGEHAQDPQLDAMDARVQAAAALRGARRLRLAT